jgi:hypothetical protein
MKSLKSQIEFIDKKLLVLYGFDGIIDYTHSICISDPDILPIDLSKLNELIDEFRKIFHAKNFSLHKTQYKILTKSQAVCMLKTCLEITSVPYDVSLKQKKKYLRLLLKNNILDDYINSLKMSENRTLISKPLLDNNNNNEIDYGNNYKLREVPPNSKIIVQPFTGSSLGLKENENNNEIDYSNNYKLREAPPNPNPNPNPKIIVQPFTGSSSGLKEYAEIKTITKEKLNNSIKKINKFEYVIVPKKLLNSKSNCIKINMKNCDLSNNILKSFCVKFVSKEINSQPNISEYFVSELIKNISFEVIIGGNIPNWSGKFVNNANCIVDNIILPLNCLKHHIVYLNLTNIDPIVNLLENFELEISGEYVDLYSEIENSLQSNLIEQIICVDNKYNFLRIMSGMAGNANREYLSIDEFNYKYLLKINSSSVTDEIKLNSKKDITNESEFIGKSVIINDIEGYEIVKFKIGFDICYIEKALSYGYDFVCWKKSDSFENMGNYYRKKIYKNKFSHNYKIKICGDYVYNRSEYIDSIDLIEIMIGNMNFYNFDEFKLSYFMNDIKIDHDIKFTLSNNIIKINLDSYHLYTINTVLHIGLEFISSSSKEPIIDEIYTLVNNYIWSNKYILEFNNKFKKNKKINFIPNILNIQNIQNI